MQKAAIGVDIGGGTVKLGLVRKDGKIVLKDIFRTEPKAEAKVLVKNLCLAIHKMMSQSQRFSLKVIGVGVGAPGPVSKERGLVYSLTNIRGWRKVPLGEILQRKLKVPVSVDNDANAMALGEFFYGAGMGARTMIALTLGTGVGGGLVIERKLFRGSFFSAAEIGHLVINEEGPRCACGNRGCVEAYVGSNYFTAFVKKRLQKENSVLKEWMQNDQKVLTPRLVAEAALKGDLFSQRVWSETGGHLGTALAGLVNILNPEKIVIGGGIAQSGSLLFGPIRNTIKKKAFPIASSSVKVVAARLGVDAGIIGSAALVFSL